MSVRHVFRDHHRQTKNIVSAANSQSENDAMKRPVESDFETSVTE
jgi:hypothetical protein